MGQKEDIEVKLMQALVIWKNQGGPKSLKIIDAVKLAQKSDPRTTENEIRNIVKSSSLLDLKFDDIILNKDLTDLM